MKTIYLYVCVYLYKFTCRLWIRIGYQSTLELELNVACELPCGCWDLNSSPLQDQ